jgi:hypothetical protein
MRRREIWDCHSFCKVGKDVRGGRGGPVEWRGKRWYRAVCSPWQRTLVRVENVYEKQCKRNGKNKKQDECKNLFQDLVRLLIGDETTHNGGRLIRKETSANQPSHPSRYSPTFFPSATR